MKKYQKAQIIAKNLPTGSYAAGCPQYHNGHNASPNQPGWGGCKSCERSL